MAIIILYYTGFIDYSLADGQMYMGVSENSVPLNPLVLLIIIPIKWLFHWEYTLFSDKPIWYNYIVYKSGNYSYIMLYPLNQPGCQASSLCQLSYRTGGLTFPGSWFVLKRVDMV